MGHIRSDVRDLGRARAAVPWLLHRAAADGHTAQPTATVRRVLAAYGFDGPDAVLAALVAEGVVLALESDARPDGLLVALPALAAAEDEVAAAVARLQRTARHLPGSLGRAAEPDGGPDPAGRDRAGTDPAEALRAAAVSGVSVAQARTAPAAAAFRAALHAHGAAAGSPVTVLTGADPPPGELAGQRGLVLVEGAGALDVSAMAALLGAVPDGAHVVLLGDPAGLAAPGPGDVLAALAACPTIPTHEVAGPDGPGAALARLAAGIARGELTAPQADDREVVVVPASSDDEAAHRVFQLVTESIPRAFSLGGRDICVLTLRSGGPAGVDALAARLGAQLGEDAPAVRTPAAALAGTWPAIVLALPGSAAGSLSRDLLASAVGRAERHLSVVHAAGGALAQAVAACPRRRRVTRLPDLLAAPR